MRAVALVGLLALGSACRYDRDGDGFVGRDDCDDDDALVFPGAPERCNGLDDDCDHLVDEAQDVAPRYVDADGDGHGDPDQPLLGCPSDGGVAAGDDCDDTRDDVYPGAPEACDDVDQNCNGVIDESPSPPRYADRDGDGVGAELAGCVWFAVEVGGDCDDADDTVFPGAPELCDGLDNDCDGVVAGEQDEDADGARVCDDDCDDDDPLRAPGRVELCNAIDDDCDGQVDGDAAAWFDPRWPVRVPVQASSEVPTTRPLVLDLDGEAALASVGLAGPFDPAHVRVMVQRCDDGVMTELPAVFLDAQLGLDATGDPSDALGNGRGAMVILHDLDGDLATVEPWQGALPFAVYLGGPEAAPGWSTDLVVEGTTLTAASTTSAFVPDRGGLVELSVDGVVVASQADTTAGNGLRTSAGSLSAALFPATPLAADANPLTAAVASVTELSNGGGAVFSGYAFRRFAGRPELWVRQRLVTVEPTTIAGPIDRTSAVRPWQASFPELTAWQATVAPDFASGHIEGVEGGLAWAWLAPPAYLTHVDDDGQEAWMAANDVAPCCDGTSGGLPTGAEVVAGAVLVVHPHLGPLDAEAWAASQRVEQVVGPPERLP